MTWQDFHQRQHALHAVLERAGRNPDAPLIPVPEGFADLDELLAALQHTWTQRLTGRIDVAITEAADEPHHDRVEAVTDAWRRTAAANPELRALLDRHVTGAPRPGRTADRALYAERRLLALSSGLAEEHEGDVTINRVGGAFQRLLRATEPEPVLRHTCALTQLRRLIPSL